MPTVRKMTPEEVAAIEEHRENHRREIIALYDELLRDCQINDAVEIELEPDERRPTVIARLKAAAARRQPALVLEFRDSDDPLVISFVVQDPSPPRRVTAPLPPDPEPHPEPEPQPRSFGSHGSRFARSGRGERPYQPRQGRPNRYERPSRNGTHPRAAGASGTARNGGSGGRGQRPGGTGRPNRPSNGPSTGPSSRSRPRRRPR